MHHFQKVLNRRWKTILRISNCKTLLSSSTKMVLVILRKRALCSFALEFDQSLKRAEHFLNSFQKFKKKSQKKKNMFKGVQRNGNLIKRKMLGDFFHFINSKLCENESIIFGRRFVLNKWHQIQNKILKKMNLTASNSSLCLIKMLNKDAFQNIVTILQSLLETLQIVIIDQIFTSDFKFFLKKRS